MTAPWRARRARYVILAIFGIVLAGTVASYFSRRRWPPAEPPRPTPIAEDVGQQTHAFSLSKTLGEHTLYTIQADQVTNYEDTGKALLHNVSVLIYGKDGSRRDRIASPESYYDPAAASIWIPGEVEMQFDLSAPQPERPAGSQPSAIPISIFTSKLSFEQNTGIAATDAPVRFVFAQGEGTAQGAAYDPEKEVLTLRSQVRFSLAGGGSDESTLIEAGTARFFRESGRAVLENSVTVSRGERRIRAARGDIELDDQLRVRQAVLTKDLLATEETPAESREARAGMGTVSFDDTGRIRSVDLAQDVSWRMAPRRPGSLREGGAQHVEMFFREGDGLLERVELERDVSMTFRRNASRTGAAETQTLSGGEAEMTLSPDGHILQHVRVRSSPRLEILPGNSAGERRTVTGEQFDLALDDRGELRQFQTQGTVHVVSEVSGSPARRRETTSDSLEAIFGAAGDAASSLETLRQWGHFQYRDPQRQAKSEKALYTVASETVVLEGSPAVWNADGRLTAARIGLLTQTGGMTAEGDVSSTFFQKPAASKSSSEPLHVVSDRLRYDAAARLSHFEGHARLWQGESFLVEAEALDWRPGELELTASRNVYSVFQKSSGEKDGKPSRAETSDRNRTDSITITADSLIYRHEQRLARYQGAVQLQNHSGTLASSELEIFLRQAEAASGDLALSATEIERAVAHRPVKITEGARIATGDRAEYLPARNEIHLYGQLAQIADPTRGTVEGTELTYFLGDDRIQVQGSPGSPTQTRWQMRP